MEKGNVLVLGNSGVGKSTLINAVLGETVTETGRGTKGTTKELKIYTNDEVPFRLIDSVGFEPNHLRAHAAIDAVKKWSKDCAKEGKEDNQINQIWLCVDGTASKLFPDTIKNMVKAISIWKSVPVIAVITKSYSKPEREENIKMVMNAFSKQKRVNDLRDIIPVVAQTYIINDDTYVAPEGIDQLIKVTNELMPEGIKAAEKDISIFRLKRKRALAQSIIGTATTAGAVVGAIPIPFADAAILSPTEVVEIKSIARVFGVKADSQAEDFINAIVESGTIGLAAKTIISALKGIPGINLGASAVNAVIAGGIILAIGEVSAYAFEQVYLGNKSMKDIDWVKKLIEDKLTSGFVAELIKTLENIAPNSDPKDIAVTILKVLTKK